MTKKLSILFFQYKTDKGFTFIELLLVVAIMLIIGVMSVPFMARFFNQNAVEDTSANIIQSLRKAQIYSMMGKQNNSWGLNYDLPSQQVTFYLNNTGTFATHNTSFDEIYHVATGVTVSGFNSPITFTRVSGIPSSTPTITITSNTSTRTLTVNAQGMVTR